MFVKPAEGRTVRRPDTLVFLLPDGEDVSGGDVNFWTARVRDKDVIVIEEGEAPIAETADADPQSEPSGFFEIPKSPHHEEAQS